MKVNKSSCIFFFLIISGCGGGSSPTSTTTTTEKPPQTKSHSIQLGPIAGATVNIYRPDCKSSVYQTTTDDNGSYMINVAQLESMLGASVPEMLCVESIGGKDVDPNDDGIRSENEVIAVQGRIRGFVKTSDLLTTNGTRINLFGSALADLIGVSDDVTLARIEQLAQQIGVPDMDNDGKITISDVTRYEMGAHTNGEESLRSLYLRSIHEGNNAERSFFIESSDTSIASVRPTFVANGDGTLQISLTRYSRDGVIYYGNTLQNQLSTVYSRPFSAKANEIVYMQECRDTNCYAVQAIQVTSSGTKFVEYTDTGGVDLSVYYTNIKAKKDLAAKIEAAKKLIDQANSQIATNNGKAVVLQGDISQLDAEIASIDEEILQLKKNGG